MHVHIHVRMVCEASTGVPRQTSPRKTFAVVQEPCEVLGVHHEGLRARLRAWPADAHGIVKEMEGIY